MSESKNAPRKFTDEERTALSLLRHFCSQIGSGNDAEDHGYTADAERMREASRESIRNLLDDTPLLSELFPELPEQLDTAAFRNFGWMTIYRATAKYLPEERE